MCLNLGIKNWCHNLIDLKSITENFSEKSVNKPPELKLISNKLKLSQIFSPIKKHRKKFYVTPT